MDHKLNEVETPADIGLLMRMFDALPAGILVIRADRTIAYANTMFLELWRVPDDVARYRNDIALMNHVLSQVADVPKFISEVERLYASTETSEDEVDFKDGRIFWRRSYPIREDDGQLARVWVFIDVAAARHAIAANIQKAAEAVREATDVSAKVESGGWFNRKSAEVRNALKL